VLGSTLKLTLKEFDDRVTELFVMNLKETNFTEFSRIGRIVNYPVD
jgi:hypothetical protein